MRAARMWLIVLACLVTGTCVAAVVMPTTVITRGQFIDSGSTTPPEENAAWEEATLPEFWATTRPKFWLNGWYRFNVHLDSVPDDKDGVGLYIATIRSQSELYVNGHYAGASGVIYGPAPDRIGYSQLYVVPGAYLREGANVVHLRVFRPGRGGGLTEIKMGSYPPLYFAWLIQLFYYFASYALVGVGISITGLFILAFWIQRRPQSEYFYFGAGALVWGLHSLFRLVPGQRFPLNYTVIWHFSNLLSVTLLTIFCLRFAHRRWRPFEQAMWICTIALLPSFYGATLIGNGFIGYLPQVTEFAHDLYNVFMLVALYGVILRVREDNRNIESWLLLLGALSFSAPRMIAWLGINERNSLDSLSLTPAAIFTFVLISGWILVERFVRTASELEKLNTQLELRVADKSQALQTQLAATETAREEAEKANLAKSRFLAAASHDLRQPLHALGLFASALNDTTQDPESRSLVSHINQSIGALSTLFNEVLDVSKLDAGAISPSFRNVSLQRVFERIADALWADAESRLLRLRLVPNHFVVRSDPVLLERILRNLVHNAIRYTSHGGVVVGARRRGNRLNVEVWDTGIGIAADDQAKIFEEFYQVGNPERDRSRGLGLGLAIVKRLSDLLEHPLTVRSKVGRGSVFCVSMEMSDAPADAAPTTATPAAPEMHTDALRDKCVTIIDNEPSVREGMAALLASWHCEAIVAADEHEAVTALIAANRKPALLIVDYRLRDQVIGIDVIQALRARFGQDIPAVIVSGESSAEELAHIKKSGLPMLHKPVSPAKLRSLVFYLSTSTNTRNTDSPATTVAV